MRKCESDEKLLLHPKTVLKPDGKVCYIGMAGGDDYPVAMRIARAVRIGAKVLVLTFAALERGMLACVHSAKCKTRPCSKS